MDMISYSTHPPASPVTGDTWYCTTTQSLHTFLGSGWQPIPLKTMFDHIEIVQTLPDSCGVIVRVSKAVSQWLIDGNMGREIDPLISELTTSRQFWLSNKDLTLALMKWQ